MKIIDKIEDSDFPFDWINLEYYPDSVGSHKEFYLDGDGDEFEELIFLFYSLFGEVKEKITVYNKLWWDFCLDTWNPITDSYNYELEGKSDESQSYLKLLDKSNIEKGYSGSCTCSKWDEFLPTVLRCIISHQAPYSPIFYCNEYNFFFYFHHSGSIGFYYNENNAVVKKILTDADKEFVVK